MKVTAIIGTIGFVSWFVYLFTGNTHFESLASFGYGWLATKAIFRVFGKE